MSYVDKLKSYSRSINKKAEVLNKKLVERYVIKCYDSYARILEVVLLNFPAKIKAFSVIFQPHSWSVLWRPPFPYVRESKIH